MTTGLIPISEPAAQAPRNSSAPSTRRYIRLGPIQVDLQKEEVTKNGSRLKLSGKPYRALVTLLERPEQIVTRDTMRACLWPSHKTVEYNTNVNTTINKLRRALGDSSLNPLYIATIPQKGYALIGHPEVSDHPKPSDLPEEVPGADPMQPRLLNEQLPVTSTRLPGPAFRFWSISWALALILIGMLAGIGISAFWISYRR